jgi:hypothetical protein
VRIHYRKHSAFVSAALLGAVTTLGVAATAQAMEPAPFTFTAYSNGAGGGALASGEYDTAAKALTERIPYLTTERGALDTNRCVAYAMTRQFPAARAACDAAIKDARLERVTFSLFGTEKGRRYDAASAYSNRAVLEWLLGDGAAAEQDLAEAERLAPEANFVVRNLTALHKHSRVTAVAVANQSATPLP